MADVFVEFICAFADFDPFPVCFVELCKGVDKNVGDVATDAAAAGATCVGGGTGNGGGG